MTTPRAHLVGNAVDPSAGCESYAIVRCTMTSSPSNFVIIIGQNAVAGAFCPPLARSRRR
jgi:hypothetical protein